MGVLRRSRLLCAALRKGGLCLRAGTGAALALLATLAGLAMPCVSPLSPTAVRADSSFDSALLSLFNQDRAARGVAPLRNSGTVGELVESSPYGGCGFTVDGRAEDMLQRNYLTHTIQGCGNQNVFDILRANNVAFLGAAENIGYVSGVTDPTAAAEYVNRQFMASTEHADNILNPNYTAVGIGSWWTAPGQTWTGAGSTMSNVVVVSTAFIQEPHPAAPTSAPTHAPRPRAAAPAPVRPAAARSTAPSTATRRPAVPPPAATSARAAPDGGPPAYRAAVLDQPAIPVAGVTVEQATPSSLRLQLTCGGVGVAALGALRRRVARRRRPAM